MAAVAASTSADPAREAESKGVPAPLGVTAVAASPSQIVIAWVAAPGAPASGYEVLHDGEQVSFTAGTSASQAGLSPWREYCYAVRSYDAQGRKSEPSKPACARTLDVEAPTTPPEVLARPLSEEEIEVTWSASQDDGGIAWYEVWREARGTLAAVEDTRIRERYLEQFTQYCYTVRARDHAGNFSAPSAPACARTLKTTRPSPPPDLVARATSDTEIRLSWGASSDEFGIVRYEVRRGDEIVAEEKDTTAMVRGLMPFREYCFDVVAVDSATNRSAPARACATTPDVNAPGTPGEVRAIATSASSVLLEWSPAPDDVGVTGYEIQRGDARVAVVSGTSTVDAGAPPGTEQCYTVRALDAAGNSSAATPLVCVRTGAPGTPPAPRNLVAEVSSRTSVRLRWDPAPQLGVVYRIFWDSDRAIGLTRETRFTAMSLEPGERHCYTVAAIDESGRLSVPTPPVCIAPHDEVAAAR